MTQKEFKSLPAHAQDKFLEEGGIIEQERLDSSGLSSLPEVGWPTPISSVKAVVNSDATANPPVQSSQFDGFDVKDPMELLFLLDKNIREGRVSLYPWQIQCLLDFAEGGVTDKNPFQALVRACNGSGKDKYIIAPCVVWLCMRYKLSLGVVTSSSGVQLDNQTCRYIKFLAEEANRTLGLEIWECKYRHYVCNFGNGEKSEIFCYATDEAGKAEGYHPTVFGAKMALFQSEAKSIHDDINVAMNKCTGYTHRMHVSTPGLPIGHFYDYCNMAIDRKKISSIKEVKPTDWIKYHVTAYDCLNHLNKNYIDQMKRDLPGGERGAAFQSQVMAEFGTNEEMVVIPYTYIWKSVNGRHKSYIPEDHNTGGLDLSDGGAETVLAIRNGNKLIHIEPFRFSDATDTIQFLNEQFKKWDLDNPHSRILGDCVGMGKPILDSLKKIGWKNIWYVDSRAAARRPKVFKNRATEIFFNLRDLLEKGVIILLRDDLLMKQLGGRYYKITPEGKHQLLSKLEQKSKDYPSPDRADAVNLAFWNYESPYVDETDELPAPYEMPEEKKEPKIVGAFDARLHSKGEGKKWIANDGIPLKNFSYLEEEIARYNQQILNK